MSWAYCLDYTGLVFQTEDPAELQGWMRYNMRLFAMVSLNYPEDEIAKMWQLGIELWPHLCVQPLYDLHEGLEAVSRKIFRDYLRDRDARVCKGNALLRCDIPLDRMWWGPWPYLCVWWPSADLYLRTGQASPDLMWASSLAAALKGGHCWQKGE